MFFQLTFRTNKKPTTQSSPGTVNNSVKSWYSQQLSQVLVQSTTQSSPGIVNNSVGFHKSYCRQLLQSTHHTMSGFLDFYMEEEEEAEEELEEIPVPDLEEDIPRRTAVGSYFLIKKFGHNLSG